ncbi:TetR/AcrR family transcriptional regulator [Roseateles sp. SL47]|uniref:TetR/AcrR family transcriptional regulator n=1 Tax=Roseateles sp. SL47 TaxID=2995138 RepID=UPI002270EEF4|nr:TetR/AcrR family transcriptional regulator [Roseateles sp. SL47]WAC71341.1 TetR/AcrR family transcriptional regulator [Roseateles sp. SL47]
MRVSKAQAQANRARVVETASQLFRERGYDGVGVADLMAAAGFTHGGFYKQFGSKTDLIAESAACGMAQTLALTGGDVDPVAFIGNYLSREHRDGRGTGCTMAALGGDAARQPEEVRAAFANGIEGLVVALLRGKADDPAVTPEALHQARAQVLNVLSHAVGALMLSRACPDASPLADEVLAAARQALVASVEAARAPTDSTARVDTRKNA